MINPEMHSGGGSRSSSDIESDIRRTRGRMDATLDELSDRLTARSVLHTLLDLWEARQPSTPQGEARTQRVYGAFSRQVTNQIRENPVPTLLIGAGLAWMFMDRGREADDREYVEISGRRYRVHPSRPSGPAGAAMAGTPAGEYEYEELEYDEIEQGPGFMEKAKEKLSSAAASAKDKITGAGEAAKERVEGVGEAAHDAAERARMRARGAYYRGRSRSSHLAHGMAHEMRAGYDTGAEKFNRAVDEYPLGVGIGFAALGALVGLLLPHTRREDELLGERSDELMETVKEKGKEAFERGKVVAERVAETALDEAQKQGLTAEAASEKLSALAGKAGEIAKKAKEEASIAAEEQKLTPQHLKSEAAASSGPIPSQSGSINMPPKGASHQGDF